MRLSEDHEAYRDHVRRFMEGVVRPLTAEFDLWSHQVHTADV